MQRLLIMSILYEKSCRDEVHTTPSVYHDYLGASDLITLIALTDVKQL